MKEINLREANQQFSRLVREVEETGEPVMVTRNGEDAVVISPARERDQRALSPTQEAALQSLIENARRSPGNSEGRRWTRDELYDRD